MKIEAADLFTKHIANSKFEDLDNKTIKNLKKKHQTVSHLNGFIFPYLLKSESS